MRELHCCVTRIINALKIYLRDAKNLTPQHIAEFLDSLKTGAGWTSVRWISSIGTKKSKKLKYNFIAHTSCGTDDYRITIDVFDRSILVERTDFAPIKEFDF